MNATDLTAPGTLTGYGDSGLLFFDQSILATTEPSGKASPLFGTPCLWALIITGFARITLIPSFVWLGATSPRSRSRRTSENAIPFGDFNVNRSCAAKTTVARRQRNRAASTPILMLLRFIFKSSFFVWILSYRQRVTFAALRHKPADQSSALVRSGIWRRTLSG